MSGMMTFDATALMDPIPPGVVKAEASERLRDEVGHSAGTRITAGAVIRTVVLVLGFGVLAALGVRAVQLLFGGDQFTPSTVVIAALMVTPLLVMQVRGITSSRRQLEQSWFRLGRFAAANGLTHTFRVADPSAPAALFAAGSNRISVDVMGGAAPSVSGDRSFEAGNHGFETWTARARFPHEFDYVMLSLSTPPPAFTLIDLSHAKAWPAWDPAVGQQPVELGDGFDERFETRCAPEVQGAVRAALTPSLRAALTSLVARAEVGVDLEVVDGLLYVVVRRDLSVADPAYWEWVEDLARFVDEHLDPRPGTLAPLDADEDPQRAARRARLLSRVRGGRPAVMGCLLPLVFGVLAAAASVLWR
ncbi:hypothetical protein [Psychromicrobium xiongbiense]|uniref:hypothetical protein n=1 Tax=Psychromicrobium xiongbiense TaxID=3051184 RepID=UPI0025551247|nr:hypothetical protein [Psychromicrobium sp. YIM S02556]